METRINQLSQQMIICGYGRMGRRVATDLKARGVPVVVLDNEPTRVAEAEDDGVLAVLGDATEEESLVRAGLPRARGLVTVLRGDSDNVYVALTARSLRSDLRIVARAEQQSTVPKLQRAGANSVICPQEIGATRITNVLTRPHVVDFVEVAARGVELEMDEYVVAENSPLCEKTLQESGMRQKTGATVVVIKRADGTTLYSPGAHEGIHRGDVLILIGPAGTSARLEKLSQGPS